MTVTTGARGSDSALCDATSSSVKASGSSRAAVIALWPISSTRIMAVSWSSDWLMVTSWPIFISTLMTSEALIAILCASSDTVMVSGTCTSSTRCSVGADCWWSSRSRWSLRPPRGPPRHELRPTPPDESPRVLISFFLVGSLAQLEDSLADFTSLPAPGAAGAAGAPRRGAFARGVWRGALVGGLAGFGALAARLFGGLGKRNLFWGVLIPTDGAG